MYAKLPNLVIGFHGCSQETYTNVLYNNQQLKKSDNKYDWLGNGIYFWENSYQRAYEWADKKYKKNAAVLGAVIDLGLCLNLTDYNSTDILRQGYEMLKMKCIILGIDLPENKQGKSKTDLLLRDLDCAVIQQIHEYNKETGKTPYDSVRGVFTEGENIYPNAGFVEKTHIQLCIVNPNCIKGYFRPLAFDENYGMP
ncbi:MAG: hypothetical protein K2K54_14180 [Lachnospiraceae bacterium]|nr:hypothetical protein [Lachnospiraceae bacterium]